MTRGMLASVGARSRCSRTCRLTVDGFMLVVGFVYAPQVMGRAYDSVFLPNALSVSTNKGPVLTVDGTQP